MIAEKCKLPGKLQEKPLLGTSKNQKGPYLNTPPLWETSKLTDFRQLRLTRESIYSGEP
jgi:hypothetical protein